MTISHIMAESCPDWVWWLRSTLLLAEKLKMEFDVGRLKDTPSLPHLSRIRVVPGWAKIYENQWKLVFTLEVKERCEESAINTNV
jgi:hypothetical protein